MNTTFHFASAQEITPGVLDIIRQTYQEKPVSLYVREENPFVPEWQKIEVRRRDNNPSDLLDCEMVIAELEKELETE